MPSCIQPSFFFLLQLNGKWRVVIVDQGWTLGSRAVVGAGGGRKIWHPILGIRLSTTDVLPAERTRDMAAPFEVGKPQPSQRLLFSFKALTVWPPSPPQGRCTGARRAPPSLKVKWERALEEGLKGSDTSESHFKQTISTLEQRVGGWRLSVKEVPTARTPAIISISSGWWQIKGT